VQLVRLASPKSLERFAIGAVSFIRKSGLNLNHDRISNMGFRNEDTGFRDRVPSNANRHAALRFVLLIGVMSFFADFTYEGARSVYGPFLAGLAASATVVGVVTGLGELVGYGFRLVSGRWVDRSGNFWAIAIFGYFVQLLAVPALALANNWPTAAALIILERFGKATRNPPRDAMLSHARQRESVSAGHSVCMRPWTSLVPSSGRCWWLESWRGRGAIVLRFRSFDTNDHLPDHGSHRTPYLSEAT